MDKIRALRLSLIAIVSVALLETLSGFIVNSLVILSDAAHAAFDAVTTAILLVTTQLALKPPDENHTYGHGKIESIGGLVGGIALIIVSMFLMYESVLRLVFGGAQLRPGYIGFAAIGYTLCVDIFRVATLSRTKEKNGLTIKADLYHAFADMASTVVALLGFYLASVIGLSYGDTFGSLILSVLLASLSVGLIRTSSMELSDAISKTVLVELRRRVLATQGVLECKELKARKVGTKYFVDVTIVASEQMEFLEAHDTATRIESNIASLLGDAVVTVHMEPSARQALLESKVIDLAAAVNGVKEVHNINVSYVGGDLYVTLHAQVEGSLPLEEAHSIAERIEQELHREVDRAAKITVHLEPFNPLRRADHPPLFAQTRLNETVRQLVENRHESMKVKKITTYASGEKRFINIDLTFNKGYSIEEAHRVSSDIERQLRRTFRKTVVTIHPEPEPNS